MPISTSQDAWLKSRGLLKAVYAEFGGGEAYLRSEQEHFYDDNSLRSRTTELDSEQVL